MIYARKLLAAFPDEPDRSQFYTSQMIVPRFLQAAVTATRLAMRAGNEVEVSQCLDDIAFLEGQQVRARATRRLRSNEIH